MLGKPARLRETSLETPVSGFGHQQKKRPGTSRRLLSSIPEVPLVLPGAEHFAGTEADEGQVKEGPVPRPPEGDACFILTV